MAIKCGKTEKIQITKNKITKICLSNNNIISSLGLIIKHNSSETTLSSLNNRDNDELIIKKTITNFKLLKKVNSFHCYLSANNLIITNFFKELLFNRFNKEKKDKLLKNEIPFNSNEKKINYRKSIKKNEIEEKNNNSQKYNKTISKYKKCIKDNNELKSKREKISNKKKNNDELYGYNYNINSMNESAPRLPELFSKVYNLSQKKILFKDNDSFGILNKDNIPNVFYNHLINCENNKNKYNKILMIERNKKKLLTIIYYSP